MMVQDLPIFNLALLGLASLLIRSLIRRARISFKTTRLSGPSSRGCMQQFSGPDLANMLDRWAVEYGSAFQIPGPYMIMGATTTVVLDPKAMAHIFARTPNGYECPSTEGFTKLVRYIFNFPATVSHRPA